MKLESKKRCCQKMDISFTDEFPHRQQQISLLCSLLCNETPIGMVHVFGMPSTGKTSIVRSMFEKNEMPYIYIDCHECSSSKRLFERILMDISELPLPEPDQGPKQSSKKKQKQVDSNHLTEFRSPIQYVANMTELLNKRSAAIVLDNVERVRRYPDDDPMVVLTRLHELSQGNILISLVTISDLPWRQLFGNTSYSNSAMAPIEICFPNYTKDELVDVLTQMKYKASSIGGSVGYSEFVRYVLDLIHASCRDPVKLHCQLQQIWKDCGEPQNYANRLKKVHESFAARSHQLFVKQQQNSGDQMPITSKYLLIAAFLASYNPQQVDKRFLLKHHGRDKVQVKPPGKRAVRRQNLMTGPKIFPLERLLAIYRCIAKEDDKLNNKDDLTVTNALLGQISNLVSARLIQLLSASAMLDIPKYRCLADFNLVDEIAKSVNFNLTQRLTDFVDAM